MQDSPLSDPVTKYRFKLKTEDGQEEEEEVEINTKKEIETFHVPKTSPDKKETLMRRDEKKECLLAGEGRVWG